ncbi:ABC transporter substrate-binding protein [Rhizobium sp. TH2]|uniref:heme/hemin ABC transporter substrate-binding protein n=1 Tax=Rhizobium sp. TH2 TaxID=2775403 RepID=UPI002157271E|nr:ABC transporter substrate-binding protein [Rhizobium sp. TH2]UVC09638.1 ABC transporter substrate-binding protein [Rhizobium sp. TH2]
MLAMTLRRRALLAFAALSLVAGPLAAQEIKPVDTSRLVTVGGAVTEIVFALGYGDKVIARDITSFYPDEVNRLPSVGYMRALSPEGVLSVNPSAILLIQGSGPKETIDVLSKASVPLAFIPEGYDRNALVAKIKAVGKALGADAKADELAANVAADVDSAVTDAGKIDMAKRKRVLFVMTVQNGKIMAAGEHTAAHGIIALAGGINATSDFHGYKPLNDEAVINAKPDVILLMDTGGQSVSEADILANPAVALTPAGQAKRVIRLGGSALLFGPRTGDAIRKVYATLYGG